MRYFQIQIRYFHSSHNKLPNPNPVSIYSHLCHEQPLLVTVYDEVEILLVERMFLGYSMVEDDDDESTSLLKTLVMRVVLIQDSDEEDRGF
jgi:predicted neuraminidase